MFYVGVSTRFFFSCRYVVRAKAGKKQSSKDANGRVVHSAGASLRRYNELALKKVFWLVVQLICNLLVKTVSSTISCGFWHACFCMN